MPLGPGGVNPEVFMALMSVVILGRRLNAAQWCSLLVISSALLLSTVAEGKGGKKGSSAAGQPPSQALEIRERGREMFFPFFPSKLALQSGRFRFGLEIARVCIATVATIPNSSHAAVQRNVEHVGVTGRRGT